MFFGNSNIINMKSNKKVVVVVVVVVIVIVEVSVALNGT